MSEMNSNIVNHNLLFIGETGSGKSTFINCLANIVSYESYEQAIKSKPITLVGTEYAFENDVSDIEIINACDDDNESHNYGESATQYCKPHKFVYDKNTTFCIIDTPGTGDTRGKKSDESNLKNIDEYLKTIPNLRTVCIILKSNQSRLTHHFENCLISLLNQMHKNILKNLIFIFTYAKSVNFDKAQAMLILNKFFKSDKAKHSNIDFKVKKDIVFCVEGDVFNHLLSQKKGNVAKNYKKVWNRTRTECFNMLEYIFSLTPLNAQEIKYLHKIRHLLENIIEPIVNVVEIIEINTSFIDKQNMSVLERESDIEEIRKSMETRKFRLNILKLEKPQMVCTSVVCRTSDLTDESRDVLYPQVCCENCGWLKHLFGHLELKFEKMICNKCKCSKKYHKRVYHVTKIVVLKNTDIVLREKLTSLKIAKEKLQNHIDQSKTESSNYKYEKSHIIKSVAKFAIYLENNIMSTYADIFVDKMIDKIQELSKNEKYLELKSSLRTILLNYEDQKKLLKYAGYKPNAQEISKLIDSLCLLEFSGPAIKSLHGIIEEKFVEENLQNDKTKITKVGDWFRKMSHSEKVLK